VSEQAGRERDHLTVSRLTGAAWRHASGWEPSGAPAAAAVRELREIAGGHYRRTAEEPKARAAAYYCIAAGAGLDLIPRWIETGRSRAAAARLIPPAVPEAQQAYTWPEAV